jgi:hypothetical protein
MSDQQTAYQIVQEQADEDGLWFVGSIVEAFFQQELRRLHAAVEREHAAKESGQGTASGPEAP